MSVPAAERITTRIKRFTPVLIELIVCQIARPTLRTFPTIASPFNWPSFGLTKARFRPEGSIRCKRLLFNDLIRQDRWLPRRDFGYNTQVQEGRGGVRASVAIYEHGHSRGLARLTQVRFSG